MNTMPEPSGSFSSRVRHAGCYQEVTIISAGAPILLSIWRGDRGAPTVVFLPGTMTHPLFYEEFLEGLHRRGLSVVGVHYQGHGKSPRVRSRLGWANLVANATDAVDWAATSWAARWCCWAPARAGCWP